MTIKLTVKLLTGKSLNLEFDDQETTIDTIKEEVLVQSGGGAAKLDLFYGGKLLEDGRTLKDYNIPDKAELKATPRLRGG